MLELPKAANDVMTEVLRVRVVEGYTVTDDTGKELDLALASGAYIYAAHARELHGFMLTQEEAGWPPTWDPYRWKPKGFRSDLIKAAALAIFAIEAYDNSIYLRDLALDSGFDLPTE